jgi:coproporphyrinogen III oxidase
LQQEKLPNSFVLPEIQPYLNTYQAKLSASKTPVTQEKVKPSSIPSRTKSNLVDLKNRCIDALDYYLKHRDETLNFFSYFFDYYRGKVRAEHYKQLINLAQTEQELYLIEYAILVNTNGAQLKKG